jgi:ABC-type transporter Mla subunit MlaD
MKNNFLDIRKYPVEIRIGGFFLGALLLLFIALLSMRELTFFKGTYVLNIKFDFAEGLRPASPVRFCGVDVGEVRDVEIKEENNRPVAYVYVKVQKEARIPKGSYFFINSLSLFGEKYLEITPPQAISDYLKEGESVEGISPTPLFNVFTNFNMTMEEIKEFVKEGKLKTSLENTMKNFEEFSEDIKKHPWKLLFKTKETKKQK